MDDDGSLILTVLLFFACILLSGFFSASEAAVISINDAKLKRLHEEGNQKAKLILKMLSSPSRFLGTISAWETLSALGASFTLCFFWLQFARAAVSRWNTFAPGWLIQLALLIVVLFFGGFFLVVLGRLVPRKLGSHKPEKIAFTVVRPALFFHYLLSPFYAVTSGAAGLLVRLFGVDPNREPAQVTEEEIRMMVDVGNEKGVIEESDREMINNIFEFDDRTAGEVMTHRTDIVAVPDDAKVGDIVDLAQEEGFSRIPVYHEDIDNITGIIYVKDLLCLVGRDASREFTLQDFVREVLYVPESNRCKELFREFTEKKAHVAVVVDEYGGTSGLVTMEDLLESIVGNIQDEYDNEEEEFQKVDETTFTIDGAADLEDVSKLLGIDLPETDDYDTLGGLITDRLGRIPSEGEHPVVVVQNVEFTVELVEDRRVVKVRAVKLPPVEEPEDDE